MARRVYLIWFVAALLAFGGTSGPALFAQSSDPHFVLQAHAWLQGRVAIDSPRGDDWAQVQAVTLRDGRHVRGRRLQSTSRFVTTQGEFIPSDQIALSGHATSYMSFPAFPAVLFLPVVAMFGDRTNDTILTVCLAALVAPAMLWLLVRARAATWHARTDKDIHWLIAAMLFGTVFFFSAVGGKVWFTAHVVGVLCSAVYVAASIAGPTQRPWLAGIALGCAAVTRTPMAFLFPLFIFELLRAHGGLRGLRSPDGLRQALGAGLRFATPIVAIAVAAGIYNIARFEAFTEFGHSYLAVRQQAQIEAHGLFSYHYLARNLAVLATLMPEIDPTGLRISGHGLAIWITSPFVLMLLWPRHQGTVARQAHRALWCAVACVAVPTLFYQNSGWVQFGYRFALDYWVLLISLIAVGARTFTHTTRALIVVAVLINLFGAITFGRIGRIYRTEGRAYEVVVAH